MKATAPLATTSGWNRNARRSDTAAALMAAALIVSARNGHTLSSAVGYLLTTLGYLLTVLGYLLTEECCIARQAKVYVR
jgi:hypothetical protein